MRKYIVINSEFTEDLGIYSDLKNVNNLSMCTAKLKKYNNIFFKLLRKIHLNRKINKIINLPFKWIWYDFDMKEINDVDEIIIIIMTAEVLFTYNFDFFNKLNKKENVHLILFLIDSMKIKTPIKDIILDKLNSVKWDYIFSYDKKDAEEYNYKYLNEMYYSLPTKINNEGILENDIYYLARLKPGRENRIMNIYKIFINNYINTKFDIWLRKEDLERCSELKLENGINYFEEQKSYRETLKEIEKTNCILELLQDGQTGPTLRYFEAVVYNKKLLTNNENVKYLNFYDERYIKIFQNETEIDFNWIKEKIDVNYHYNNEFSPINIINKIDDLYDNK